ncbi:MAG TPA: NAD(P)H-dependent oxidoreductase [Mobilitalea sp.]|nr:NAD(P)H-dependent oxidoreductase [Mobilitalea sp.]
MAKRKIGVLVGSLRRGSYSKSTANALMALAPANYELEMVDISNLEFFNQDFEQDGNTPVAWTDFREQLKGYDAFILVTPEYNRSYPAVLKNALDVGSRPYGQSIWNGKPAAVVSVSIGGISGFGANHHLRQVLTFLNMPTMQQPEAYIGNATELFDDAGNLINDGTRGFLQTIMDSFVAWVDTNSAIR